MKLVGSDWKNIGSEGRGLKRAFKRLLDDMDSSQSAGERAMIAKALGYVASARCAVIKLEREHQLEDRMTRLEALAGIAQQQVISQ